MDNIIIYIIIYYNNNNNNNNNNNYYYYYYVGFTPCKTLQPLWSMELQEKEALKD